MLNAWSINPPAERLKLAYKLVKCTCIMSYNRQKATDSKMKSVALLFSHIYAHKTKAPKGLVLALQMLVIFVVFLEFTAGTCQVSNLLNYAVK